MFTNSLFAEVKFEEKMVNVPWMCVAKHVPALVLTCNVHEARAVTETVLGQNLTLNSLLCKGLAELKPGGLTGIY